MGLDITVLDNYGFDIIRKKYGSYRRIHILRLWVAFEHEGLEPEGDRYDPHMLYRPGVLEATAYPALINHSDSGGGYISASESGIGSFSNPVMWNDLDLLQAELERLAEHKEKMPADVLSAYIDLCEMVMPSTKPFMVVYH